MVEIFSHFADAPRSQRTTDKFDEPTFFVHAKLNKDDILDGIRDLERRLEPFYGRGSFPSDSNVWVLFTIASVGRTVTTPTGMARLMLSPSCFVSRYILSNDKSVHGSLVLLGLCLSKKLDIF